jgi:DNA-binding LacI/PurR family transcriptional regulator
MRVVRQNAPGDLSEKVARTIREEIASGRLEPGKCVLSERALSTRIGVSRGTVRRGLERLVNEGLLKREAGKGYSLRGPMEVEGEVGKSRSVLFVHCHSEEDLVEGRRHAQIWAGAREEAARAGLITLISSIPEEELDAGRAADLATVTGGVLCDHTRPESIRALQSAGIPVVQLDYPQNCGVHADAIIQDDLGGVALGVRHLWERGHRKIGFLDTTEEWRASGRHLNAARRLMGFRMACAEIGPEVEPLVEPTGREAREAVLKLLKRRTTAILIPHLEPWKSARATLEEQGHKLGGAFGVVLWGADQLKGEEDLPTYVTWSKEQMGREGVRRLLLRMNRQSVDPATIVIPAQLVDRGTGGRGPVA